MDAKACKKASGTWNPRLKECKKNGELILGKKELISFDTEHLIEITRKAGESKKHKLKHLLKHRFVTEMCGRKVCNYVLTKKGFGTLKNLEELGMG